MPRIQLFPQRAIVCDDVAEVLFCAGGHVLSLAGAVPLRGGLPRSSHHENLAHPSRAKTAGACVLHCFLEGVRASPAATSAGGAVEATMRDHFGWVSALVHKLPRALCAGRSGPFAGPTRSRIETPGPQEQYGGPIHPGDHSRGNVQLTPLERPP